VDSISEVRSLDPYFYFQEKEEMKMKCSMKLRLFVARATGPRRGFKVRRLCAPPVIAGPLTLGLVAMALLFSSPASAQTRPCSDDVMSAPTGPATVSTASTTSYGRVLVVGSGDYAGCSLYLLTSDQLHALTGAGFACSDNMNVLNTPCDTDLWPALLTNGAPIAGPGVNRRLLGTVTRTDLNLPGVPSVKQVTYAGYPLYRFFLDKATGDTQGANLDDPVTSPPGIWYLVDPHRGTPATGQAQLQLGTAPLGGTGPDETVLAARMNNDFSVFPAASFPVYTLNRGHGHKRGDARSRERQRGMGPESACQGLCAVDWPPLLTSGRPEAGPGVDPQALGIVVRHDGSHQVTYNGRPLYLYNNDAYIAPIQGAGTKSISGADAHTPWGVFNTIPPLH
jgi:predicted lipoprotein with Yx(FWY)xxD motif